MFQLVSNRVEFNLNYISILKMINAYHSDYITYGLLLNSVFETYYIHMPRIFASKIEFCPLECLVQKQVPLSECKPNPVNHEIIPPIVPKADNCEN